MILEGLRKHLLESLDLIVYHFTKFVDEYSDA